MKNIAFRLLFIACALLFVTNRVSFAAEEDRQGHMEAALKSLQEAKKSDAPGALLHTAKEELHKARRNKGGFKLEANEFVDQAIAEAEAGHHEKMIEKIDAAIANLHSGMAHAPGRR